jgi:septal ring factor EnvC (AmiA/AmiB activator)
LEAEIKKNTTDEKIAAEEKEKHEHELADKKKKLNEAEEAVKKQSASLEELKKQATKRNDENEEKNKEETKKLKDLNVAKNRISNEIISLETQIKKLTSEITSLSEDLKNPAKWAPNQEKGSVLSGLSGGGKKTNQSGQTGELDVPHFPRLPLTGSLYTHNGQDYLAIVYWEDYNKGKEEAERLKAKLCAKGEKNG